ncbi:nucleotide exchange factor GrpE [Buchnera aphidicola]|uniref:nucleotide exchange factor GrpE n=1 Tax=Buchnera aphidicola TaxID=9 RepID=UPI003463988D
MNSEKKQSDNKNGTQENINDIDALQNKKIYDLKNRLLENKRKIDDIELRKLANIENINKNTKEKINKIKNTETQKCLKKIIPVINSLEDILALSETLDIKDKPLIKGIELTLQSLLNILFKLGVKTEGKKNEIFNSDIHDIFETKTFDDIENNHIVLVHKKGLTLDKIILRKAIVTISKK